MKKARMFIILLAFVMPLLTGCGKKPYKFKKPISEIESIELVFVENSREFTVIKSLSEMEKNEFLQYFKDIQFHTLILGDPPRVIKGNAVKLTYQEGEYEIICHFWAEYIKDGKIHSIWRSCDTREFEILFNYFLKPE